MSQPRRGLRAALILAAAAAACSQRSKVQSKDAAAADRSDAALMPIELPDAGTRTSLGTMDRIRERFDRECPKPLADFDVGTDRGRLIGDGGWGCVYVATDVLPDSTPGVTREIDLTFREHGKATDVRSVSVFYGWPQGPRTVPPECDSVVEEAVAYVSDLMNLGAVDHRRLIEWIQRDEGGPIQRNDSRRLGWFSGAVGGQMIYFRGHPAVPGSPACGATVDADVSISPDPGPIVPVGLGGKP